MVFAFYSNISFILIIIFLITLICIKDNIDFKNKVIKYVYEDNELKEKNSSLKVNFVVTPICFDKAVAKFVHYSSYNFTDSLNDALKIEKVQLHGTDEKSKGDGLCIVEGEVCDSEGKTDRKNARNIDTVGQTDSSSASSFYVLLKDSSKSVVVAQFMTPEGSDLKSGITPSFLYQVFGQFRVLL